MEKVQDMQDKVPQVRFGVTGLLLVLETTETYPGSIVINSKPKVLDSFFQALTEDHRGEL